MPVYRVNPDDLARPFGVLIGPGLVYEVRLVAGPMTDAGGEPCASLVDHAARTISVDFGLPPHVLPLVAAAAVSLAWQQATVAGWA